MLSSLVPSCILLLSQIIVVQQVEGAFHLNSHPFSAQRHHSTTRAAFVSNKKYQSHTATTCTSRVIRHTTHSTAIQSANLITFDLDDTIFPVGPVVHDANQALIKHLTNECGYDTISQESLIASTKKIRIELKAKNEVITYTELRKRAICNEINVFNQNELTSFTDDVVVNAYNIWEQNRHLAAERYLYHDAIEMLQSLKSKYPNAIIGAITNGKGNPLKMKNSIHAYFDFCVSGEDDDVFPDRKPNAGIYMKSLERFYDLLGIDVDDVEGRNIDNVNWIHVGDDLANDVGASSKCGALGVWVDLNESSYNQSATKRFIDKGQNEKDTHSQSDDDSKERQGVGGTSSSQQPFWSTATKEEIEKRKKLNDDSMKYISAKIETLSSLPEAIETLLRQENSVLSSRR